METMGDTRYCSDRPERYRLSDELFETLMVIRCNGEDLWNECRLMIIVNTHVPYFS